MAKVTSGGRTFASDVAQGAAAGPGFVDVPVSASVLVAAKYNARAEITIVNDSDTVIYLSLGTPAEFSKGIRLNAAGGSYTTNAFLGAIYAFQAGAAPKRLTVAEV